MSDFDTDLNFSHNFDDYIKELIREHAYEIISVEISTSIDDMMKATDMIVTVIGGKIAVRIRRPMMGHIYRDFTIRSFRPSGAKTELEKIREGFADWYLYLWTDYDLAFEIHIDSWIFVNLKKVRERGILDNIKDYERPNIDGTRFVVIPISILDKYNCITDRDGASLQVKSNFNQMELFDYMGGELNGEGKLFGSMRDRKGKSCRPNDIPGREIQRHKERLDIRQEESEVDPSK